MTNASTLRAQDVIKIIPDVASRYFGYSGWCLLNKNGDRAGGDYEIWGYRYDDETSEPSIKFDEFYVFLNLNI